MHFTVEVVVSQEKIRSPKLQRNNSQILSLQYPWKICHLRAKDKIKENNNISYVLGFNSKLVFNKACGKRGEIVSKSNK